MENIYRLEATKKEGSRKYEKFKTTGLTRGNPATSSVVNDMPDNNPGNPGGGEEFLQELLKHCAKEVGAIYSDW